MINAQQSRVFAGGLNYSGYATKAQFDDPLEMFDVTTLLDSAKKFIPGRESPTMSLDLLLDTDTTTGAQWSNLTSWKSSTAQPVTWCPQGVAVGSIGQMAAGLEASFSSMTQPNAAVKASLAVTCDGPSDFGTVLESGLTAVTTTGNGTARDGGAASSNGGVAHIHSTAFSGLTNDIVTIEHSVDGATSWATLVTFATITAVGGERVVVAPATTVRRYLRVVDTVTGTGSISRTVTFARR